MLTRREVIKAGAVVGAGAIAHTGLLTVAGAVAPAPATAGKAFRIAHLTDMHVQPEKRAGEGYRAALDSLATLAPGTDLLVTGGDHVMDVMSQDADRANVQWDLYDKVLREMKTPPVRAVLGNHDVWGWTNGGVSREAKGYGKAMALDRLRMPKSYYSFDAGGWHVIVLDSVAARDRGYVGQLGPEQAEWLKGDLAAVAKGVPVVVFSHIPILAACVFFDGQERLREREWNVPDAWMHRDSRELLDLFAQHNTKLLVSGHIHLVDRVEYRGMTFACNGAVSGNWWDGPCQQFGEGYGVIDLHPDGRFDNRYITYGWKAQMKS